MQSSNKKQTPQSNASIQRNAREEDAPSKVVQFFRQRFALAALTGFVLLIISFVFSMGSQTQPAYSPPAGIEQKVDAQFHLLSFVRGEGFERQKSIERIVKLEKGDSLESLLSDEGVNDSEISAVLAAMKTLYAPKDVRVGQSVRLYFSPTPGMDNPSRFEGMDVGATLEKDIVIKRAKTGQFEATEVAYELTL